LIRFIPNNYLIWDYWTTICACQSLLRFTVDKMDLLLLLYV